MKYDWDSGKLMFGIMDHWQWKAGIFPKMILSKTKECRLSSEVSFGGLEIVYGQRQTSIGQKQHGHDPVNDCLLDIGFT